MIALIQYDTDLMEKLTMDQREPLWQRKDQPLALAELTSDAQELKEAPLRHDLRSLGRLLGELLQEQHGREFFERVEQARRQAIQHREHPQAPIRRAFDMLRSMAAADAYHMSRAFALYFELTNPAETNHRKRRRHAAQLPALVRGRPLDHFVKMRICRTRGST